MNKILVACFSASGTTEKAGKKLAEAANADFYEIRPEVPYTRADLDWMNKKSRSTLEMEDETSRPALADQDAHVEKYDTIFLGFPIWWGEAPRILDTFVESYDFTDKTVVPFCTSASSGVGSSAKDLKELAGTGNWLDGKRFSGNESSDVVMEWVNSL